MLNDLKARLPKAMPVQGILRTLEAVASMFQVELPEEEGLTIYTAILSEVPEPLLKKATVAVCKTHSYKTMPLPADFLRAIEDELWQWQWLARTLDKHIARLT